MTPRFDLIGLVTTDLTRSLDFYRRLGLDIPAGAETEPHVEAALPGGLRLAWDPVTTIRSFDPGWAPATGSPRVALAFRCADPAEVDRYYAELTGAGFDGHLPPFDAEWGMRYAVLHDPDGNGVELFASLPAT
ncbi:glyoxalase [Micromonospora acroterricola]|uniref:Glyoxalase n=1 Tax=Micromonospora acroterricola TaxID=2202421 RepID=A0A317D369_9ACTN|nr:VOC family protein [Micromonospora acroterricola]PWR09331.1 glyoxalase [Micromonospora acroterricola]